MSPTPKSPRRQRVCAVSYLNTVPLVWGLQHGPQQGCFDLSFAVPSECADRIAAGEADLGIVPVVEVARHQWDYLPGTGIACDGAVRSILLVTKVAPERIRILATDVSSRTSVLLSRVVLARRYGAFPEVVPHPPDLDSMLRLADAALVIGDPALRMEPSQLPHRALDLGAEWAALTGLPMVFAVWAGPAPRMRPGWESIFTASCRFGLQHLDEIVAAESVARGFPPELVRQYLSQHIVFELAERHYRGLRLFLNLAAAFDESMEQREVFAG